MLSQDKLWSASLSKSKQSAKRASDTSLETVLAHTQEEIHHYRTYLVRAAKQGNRAIATTHLRKLVNRHAKMAALVLEQARQQYGTIPPDVQTHVATTYQESCLALNALTEKLLAASS